MKSMTGYGYQEHSDAKLHLMIELKSYNNRYSDIFVNLPPYLSALEPKLREFLGSRVSRGRVELTLRYKELAEDLDVILDENVLSKYLPVLRRLSELPDIDNRITLGNLLSLEGLLKTDRNRDMDKLYAVIEPVLLQAWSGYEESRIKEGEKTRADILNNLAVIETAVKNITALMPQYEEQVARTFREKFQQLVGESMDENRLMAETAILVIRYSVGEEIARLGAHLESFRSLANGKEAASKKLDFLCQEMNREINTTGSKSSVLEINRIVVDVKDALEKIREQLRNVE